MRELVQGIRSWGLELSEEQLQAFQTYYEELSTWNARYNLTAITGRRQVQIRHFLDSLSCLLILDSYFSSDLPPPRLIDIGSGAGFPGMVIKIFRPDWDLTLVDSVRKKVQFLEHMVQELQLNKVTILRARAEALGQDPVYREQSDVAVGRAVADLPVLAEYLLPFCQVGGMMLAFKGPKVKAEVQRAQLAISTLGGRVAEVREVDVPDLGEARYLVVVKKIAPTPAPYPRKAGVPGKKPLV